MEDAHRALQLFWGQFSYNEKPIIAYPKDSVLPGAEFPYITFDVSGGEAFSQGILTAFDWHMAENGTNVMLERVRVMDMIARAIPQGGVMIPCGRGFIWLQRNAADFQTYYDDPDALSGVIGGRTSCIAQYLHT